MILPRTLGRWNANDYSSAINTLWVWNFEVPRAGWKELPPLPGPGRLAHAVIGLEGNIYVFGGATGQGTSARNLDDAYEFDIRTGTWRRLPDLPVKVEAPWAIAVQRSGLQGQAEADNAHSHVGRVFVAIRYPQ